MAWLKWVLMILYNLKMFFLTDEFISLLLYGFAMMPALLTYNNNNEMMLNPYV